jgi:F-type H+-transporting ATPase subunit epsilon
MSAPNETFQCVVIAPRGKLLQCDTISVVFPAHDGQVGVWRNHMPMLCKLGLGIMSVEEVPSESELEPKHTFLLIDGGFAQVSNNLLTIIAQDAICFKDMESEKIEKLLEIEKNKLTHSVYTPSQRKHEEQKLSFLMKLAEMSAAVKKEQVS